MPPKFMFARDRLVQGRLHSAVAAAGATAALIVLGALLLTTANTSWAASAGAMPAQRLKIAIVQMAQVPTLAGNRDRIIAGIADGARRGARVIVLPEAALMGDGSDNLGAVDEAVDAISRATQVHNVYTMFGATTHTPKQKKNVNWMRVIAPDGRQLFHYDKLYDQPDATMPGLFAIDGVQCGAIICADRWLRSVEEIPVQQGAKISFELSCNSSVEWVPPFGWYWYVPRAVRNNVWVVFANTANFVSGVPTYPGAVLRHGHSAIIAPDGRLVASSADDVATIVMTEIDVNEATRAEALARSTHPALREFWNAGLKLHAGEPVTALRVAPISIKPTEVTLAVAQVTGDVAAIKAKIGEASARRADVVVFPARAIPYAALGSLQDAARAHRITVVFGAEYRGDAAAPRNSAFVIGPDGTLLTRYDQLSAASPFEPGTNAASMWFRVKGVPAVVTIGRDGLWNELAELAAAAGAQIHVHLDHERSGGPSAKLRRQVWANLASFLTLTATVNVADSMIWDDLRGLEERRAPIGQQQPESGVVEVYSQYSANLVAQARSAGELLVVTRRVNATNLYHTRTIARKNPQMEPWYRAGAASILPK
ncbi:MAG: nitrilase-related carbon-nitrogen hydrolase [Opitutaceae bacterium]|nr:nitrilase-related carbon-nitrogen hydrolase [Opitutaceae bacterium]